MEIREFAWRHATTDEGWHWERQSHQLTNRLSERNLAEAMDRIEKAFVDYNESRDALLRHMQETPAAYVKPLPLGPVRMNVNAYLARDLAENSKMSRCKCDYNLPPFGRRAW